MSPVSRPVSLPHPLLPAADWADRFTLGLPVGNLTAREAARLALEHPPGWVRRLMVLRNGVVIGAGPALMDAAGEGTSVFVLRGDTSGAKTWVQVALPGAIASATPPEMSGRASGAASQIIIPHSAAAMPSVAPTTRTARETRRVSGTQ